MTGGPRLLRTFLSLSFFFGLTADAQQLNCVATAVPALIRSEGITERIGDIVFTLLPAGSVTGAPKRKTIEIIHEIENYERGYYTGIFGYFDGATLDSGVMIRFIEKTPEGLIYKSGGGITSFSRPESEYQEMIDKVYVPFN